MTEQDVCWKCRCIHPKGEHTEPAVTEEDRAKAAEIVRDEWLNAVETGAITDYGSQDAVHAAMTHMADAIAAALGGESGKADALRAAVRKLHVRVGQGDGYCRECVKPWPCATSAIADGQR